jgi:hypothetical protein
VGKAFFGIFSGKPEHKSDTVSKRIFAMEKPLRISDAAQRLRVSYP